jgi:hypothetical protein
MDALTGVHSLTTAKTHPQHFSITPTQPAWSCAGQYVCPCGRLLAVYSLRRFLRLGVPFFRFPNQTGQPIPVAAILIKEMIYG